jgi:hypothetical protein
MGISELTRIDGARRSRDSVVFGLIVGAVLACAPLEQLEKAKSSTTATRALLLGGEAGHVYDAAGEELRSAMSREGFEELGAEIRSRLGKFREAQLRTWSLEKGSRSAQVSLTYDASYEKGSAQEGWVWRVTVDEAVLVGFGFSSNRLK